MDKMSEDYGVGGRFLQTSAVLPDGSVFLIGGSRTTLQTIYYNDTWLSTDNGASWSIVRANCTWPGRNAYASLMMHDISNAIVIKVYCFFMDCKRSTGDPRGTRS